MRVRLLGRVEVTVRGAPRPMPDPQERSLLALLALQNGRWLTWADVVAALWTDPPPDAIEVVRRLLDGVADLPGLEVSGSGCRWTLGPGELDVAQFEETLELAARLPPVEALDALDDALALWSGDALDDVRAAPFARAAAHYLESRRIEAVEDRVDLVLEQGRYAELIGPLTELVGAHPTRQRLVAQLITALRDARRTEEAVSVLAEARAALAADLGIEPGAALLELEKALADRHHDDAAPPEAGPGSVVPVPRSPTVGRDDLVDRLVELLEGPDRLVTLTGLGGSGKTRVAVVAARRLQERGRRVAFVPLTGVTTHDAVATEVVGALGLGDQGDPWSALADLTSGSPVVVVLDNAEDLAGADALARRLLETLPGARLLVTARVALRSPEERELPVPPLDVPPVGADPEEVAASSAVQLFLSTCAHTAPGFTLRGHEDAVARLCRLLDGMPLALELAAARVKVLGPERLHDSLRHDLDLLASSAPGVPERHRTLMSVIAWSHDRLDPRGQAVCGRLALFESACTLDAVEAVCSDLGPIIDDLTAVVEAGLLRGTEDSSQLAFRMPPMVRAYVRELGRDADDSVVREALGRHLRRKVSTLEAMLVGPESPTAVRRFEDLVDDLVATAQWACTTDRPALAAELVLGADQLWVAAGRLREGLDLCRTVHRSPGVGERDRAALRCLEGRLGYYLTSFDECETALRDALVRGEALGDDAILTEARCYLGAVLLMRGNEAGTAMVATALADAERLDLYPLAAIALSMVAISKGMAGDVEAEAALHRRRLTLVRGRGDLPRTADALNILAEIALDESDHETAEAYAGETLRISGTDLPLERRDALITLARAAVAGGRPREAADRLSTALVEARSSGQSLAVAQCLRVAGCLAAVCDRAPEAVRLFAAADVLAPSPTGTGAPIELDLGAALETARAALGARDADHQWTLGSALSPSSVADLVAEVVATARS